MAEMEEQCDGEQRTVGDGESGGDAMAGRRHCGDIEVMEESNIVDDCGWKPKVGMPFDSEQAAYDFYNTYGGKLGFSIRKAYANKNKHTKEITSRTFVCYKEGSRGIDKRDPLVKNPRQEGGADYSPQCESQPHIRMANNSIQSGGTVYTSQGESQPHFVMGGNSIQSGGTVYTSQGESQPHFVMGGNAIQPGAAIYTCQGQSQSRFIRIMVLVSIFLNHNLVLSWVLIIIRIIVMIPTFLHLNLDLKFLWVVQVVLFLRMVHMISFQGLLRGISVENFAVHLSQASHSPADSHVDGHP